MNITSITDEVVERARAIREELHRHPELAYQEHHTAELVARRLDELGFDQVRTHVAGTGVIGVLQGAAPGQTVALRADMDALPIREETGLDYASATEGTMHACGHDGHVAILLGVAQVLAARRGELPGSVKLIFQPAEEGGAGGRCMVEAGALRQPDVDCIFALHCNNSAAPGQIVLGPTPYAGMDSFRMRVRGSGGHGAMPNSTVDPVFIASQIVVAAQAIVSREMHPAQPTVLSFCSFHAGTKENIIPEVAELEGTIRAMQMDVLRDLRRRLEAVAGTVADGWRGKVEFADLGTYPPVRNDVTLLELVRDVACRLLGPQNVLEAEEQRMGAEDFAFYLPEQGGVPGVIFHLGVECGANLHTSRFDFGSEALRPGILVMANVACSALGAS